MNKYDIYKNDLMQNIDMIMSRKMTDYQDLKHLEHLMDMCCKMDEWSKYEEENMPKGLEEPIGMMIENKDSMSDHYSKYLDYKRQYKMSNSSNDKMYMLEELKSFIKCEEDMFDEIKSMSMDCMEEKNIIKSFLQETYSKIMS